MEMQDFGTDHVGIGLTKEDLRAFFAKRDPTLTEAQQVARMGEASAIILALSMVGAPIEDARTPEVLRLAADVVETIIAPQIAMRRMMSSATMGKAGSC